MDKSDIHRVSAQPKTPCARDVKRTDFTAVCRSKIVAEILDQEDSDLEGAEKVFFSGAVRRFPPDISTSGPVTADAWRQEIIVDGYATSETRLRERWEGNSKKS